MNVNDQADLINAGQAWIADAIAQQEGHLKRLRPCTGGPGDVPDRFLLHSWDWFSPAPGVRIEMCWRCRVTRTDDDYQRARHPR